MISLTTRSVVVLLVSILLFSSVAPAPVFMTGVGWSLALFYFLILLIMTDLRGFLDACPSVIGFRFSPALDSMEGAVAYFPTSSPAHLGGQRFPGVFMSVAPDLVVTVFIEVDLAPADFGTACLVRDLLVGLAGSYGLTASVG